MSIHWLQVLVGFLLGMFLGSWVMSLLGGILGRGRGANPTG